MTNISIKSVITFKNSTIKSAIRVIDRVGLRIAYVVDEKMKLLGIVTDSEIRKAIIHGVDINEPVYSIINPHPIVLKENDFHKPYLVKKTARHLLKLMPDSYTIMVTDHSGKVKRLVWLSSIIGSEKISPNVNKRKAKKILIVGGAGYLGSVLTQKLLDLGYSVRVLDLLLFGKSHLEFLTKYPKFELKVGDMRDISTLVNALENMDVVINLAGIVGDPACRDNPEITVETNYLANKALADACKYHQINRFIFASTCSVYGFAQDATSLDENSPLNPVSLYARTKIQSEEGLLNLEDDNFSPTIFRMATLFGYSPRMRFDLLLNTMVKTAILNHRITVFNGGKQWRPLLSVSDAANAYIKCLEAPLDKVKGEIFNVGGNHLNYQIIQIGRLVQKFITGTKLQIEKESEDPRNYFVNFTKIEKRLDFKPQITPEKEVVKIKRSFEKGLIKNANEPKYYNNEFIV